MERQGLAGRRLVSAVALGIAVLVVSGLVGGGWVVAVTGGWGAIALVTVLRIWLRTWPMDAPSTAAHAQSEDYSRAVADLFVLNASVASLIAVGFTLVDARHHEGIDKGLLIVLAVAVVALSWLAVQLVFTVRYGDLYYAAPSGGISFNQEDLPDYRDFAYVAFTIGMTFQVSDTDLTSYEIRRAALRHALLSYLFGIVIVAITINVVAGLFR